MHIQELDSGLDQKHNKTKHVVTALKFTLSIYLRPISCCSSIYFWILFTLKAKHLLIVDQDTNIPITN